MAPHRHNPRSSENYCNHFCCLRPPVPPSLHVMFDSPRLAPKCTQIITMQNMPLLALPSTSSFHIKRSTDVFLNANTFCLLQGTENVADLRHGGCFLASCLTPSKMHKKAGGFSSQPLHPPELQRVGLCTSSSQTISTNSYQYEHTRPSPLR